MRAKNNDFLFSSHKEYNKNTIVKITIEIKTAHVLRLLKKKLFFH